MTIRSLWMLVATLLFTLMAAATKAAATHYGIFEIIFYRSLFGVALCFILLKRSGQTIKTTYPWRHLLRCAIGTTCITLGVYILAVMPIATAQTLTYTSPLWFCLFLSIGLLLSRSPLDFKLLSAVLVGFGGVLLILRPDFGITNGFDATMGILTGLTGGAADFMIRHLSQLREPRERIVFYFTLSGTLVGGLVTAWLGFASHTTEGLWLLAAIALTGTFAQLALTAAWSTGHPILNAVFQFSGIPFALLLGVLLFSETPDTLSLIGIAIVTIAGIVASVLRIQAEHKTKA